MSPLHQHSAILEIIPWMQNAYTLLYKPWLRDASSSSILLWFEHKQSCGPADTEEYKHFASRG